MYKIGLIGCGHMGEAIVSGLLHAHWAKANQIIVSTKTSTNGDRLREEYHVVVAKDNREVAQNVSLLILAVKPYLYREIIEEIKPFLTSSTILVSITPSFSLETLKQMSGAKATIVRAMPNTPAKVGYGMTGITFEKGTSANIRKTVLGLFACLGKVLEVEEEMMKVVGSLSGSAPAFIELYMKAMVDAGVSYGMSLEDARTLVLETFLGTAQLALATSKPLDTLIDEVCSKGGSTIRGITYLKEKEMDKLIQKAVDQTTARFVEMAQENHPTIKK